MATPVLVGGESIITLGANPFFDPSLMKKVISDLGKGINVGLGPSGILLLKVLIPTMLLKVSLLNVQ